jgi:FixJ family two-component response regulator
MRARQSLRRGIRVEKSLTVAIIDDDESLRVATSRFARSLGWHAKAYASAPEFLESGDEGRVECIITDVQMPGMTGLEMMHILKGRRCSAPVICITAFCTDDVREEALRLGAMAFLCKPVKGAEFKVFLQQIVKNQVHK